MTVKLSTHWGHLMPSKNQLWIFKMANYFWWRKHFWWRQHCVILSNLLFFYIYYWRAWFGALLSPIFKKDGFYQQTQHRNDKKWKIIEKTKKIFGDFFQYDVIQERPWFRAFLTPIFNKFFRIAFKQLEN